jgi:hypothetical protein
MVHYHPVFFGFSSVGVHLSPPVTLPRHDPVSRPSIPIVCSSLLPRGRVPLSLPGAQCDPSTCLHIFPHLGDSLTPWLNTKLQQPPPPPPPPPPVCAPPLTSLKAADAPLPVLGAPPPHAHAFRLAHAHTALTA